MNNPLDFRPALAATVILVVLAAAYKVALSWPGQPGGAPVTYADTLADSVISTAPMSKPVPEPCPPHQQVFSLGGGGNSAARRPWVVRRYVGTVGGQAATAVLQWQTPDSVTGQFYLHRGGPVYALDFFRKRPGPVVLAVDDDSPVHSQLILANLHGPTLVGTWRSAGRQQRLRLHESYAGALRYTFKTVMLAGDYRVLGACDYVPAVEHWALLLSSLAAPPTLRSRLAASPTALRHRLLADSESIDGDATASYRDEVRLNGFQLFSYETSSYSRSYNSTPDVGIKSWLFDLRTGKELTVGSQFKPGYERSLRRLLTRHLLRDPGYADGERRSGFDWRDEKGQPTSLVNLPNLDGRGT